MNKFAQKDGRLVKFAMREDLERERQRELRRTGFTVDELFDFLDTVGSLDGDDESDREVAQENVQRIYDFALDAEGAELQDILRRFSDLFGKIDSELSQEIYRSVSDLVFEHEKSALGVYGHLKESMEQSLMERNRIRTVASDDDEVIGDTEFGAVKVDRETFRVEDADVGDTFVDDDTGNEYEVVRTNMGEELATVSFWSLVEE